MFKILRMDAGSRIQLLGVSSAMIHGTRDSVVGYVSALKNCGESPDESGIPTICQRDFAKGLFESSLRWESICRRAGKLLSSYEYEVKGQDPIEVLEEADEVARDIMIELDRLVSCRQDD